MNPARHGPFELSLLFQFTKPDSAYRFMDNAPGFGRMMNASTDILDYWKKPGDKTTYQRLDGNATYIKYIPVMESDFMYVDTSFIRLKKNWRSVTSC